MNDGRFGQRNRDRYKYAKKPKLETRSEKDEEDEEEEVKNCFIYDGDNFNDFRRFFLLPS